MVNGKTSVIVLIESNSFQSFVSRNKLFSRSPQPPFIFVYEQRQKQRSGAWPVLPSIGSLPTILSNIIAAKKARLEMNKANVYPQLPFNPRKLPFNPAIHDPVYLKETEKQNMDTHRDTTAIDIPIDASKVFLNNSHHFPSGLSQY